MQTNIDNIQVRINNLQGQSSIKKGIRKIFALLMMLLTVSVFTACTDKDLQAPGQGGEEYGSADDMVLTFTLNLDKDPDTRAIEYESSAETLIDNYIDIDNKFILLFLNNDGDFLFRVKSYTYQKADRDGQWYITIPLTAEIYNNDANSYPLPYIKNYLESNTFKIAVLANWIDDDKHNNDPFELDWNWKNSHLNTGASAADKKNINELHHIREDSYYEDRRSAYSFIMNTEDSKMGLKSNWAKYRDVYGDEFNDEGGKKTKAWHLDEKYLDNSTTIASNAYTWIKNNWDPEVDKETADKTAHGIYRQYSSLWQLWNFGGSFEYDKIYDELNVKEDETWNFQSKWKDRNANDFKDKWIKSDNYVIGDYGNASPKFNPVDGLEVITAGTPGETDNEGKYVRGYNKSSGKTDKEGHYYGIILPEMPSSNVESYDSNKKFRISLNDDKIKEYLKFQIPGTGKLRILFSALNVNEDIQLIVQRGSNFETMLEANGTSVQQIVKNGSNYLAADYKADTESTFKSGDVGYKISMTADPEDIVLFSKKGSIVIYAIEFVCDEYLSGTDREGVLPSVDQPIPMYGIQSFPKIASWATPKLQNISSGGRDIKLIRALAKVVVYIAKNNEPTHIYMRSMNRMARNEIMDLTTPTSETWKSHGNGEGDCEFFRIQNYGTGYVDKNTNNFTTWYPWFYGSWWSWWENEKIKGQTDPPQIFNPDVERSDYVHFIKDETFKGNFYRYILYVPDKGLSDPNTADDLSKAPKVCHIEYRSTTMGNYTEYLDDNRCYRIYFTDYTTNETIKNTLYNGYETGYELSDDNLKQHWPIIRNHRYTFQVGQGNDPQEIRVKVQPWGDTAEPKKEEW